MPYLTGDNVDLGVEALLNGQALDVASGTIDVWNPADTLAVDGASVTVSRNQATYQVATGVTSSAGTYTYEFTLTLSGGHGIRSIQGTFVVNARYQ